VSIERFEMGLQEAFAPIEAVYREAVLRDTWGHLAPEPGRKYAGTILFTHSEYGDITVIRTDFPGLPDSPEPTPSSKMGAIASAARSERLRASPG
jgi:hypothetical protein